VAPAVTVFVDDMHRSDMGRFRGMRMSHMIATTEGELHAMAAAIGVARHWYQGDHYDVAMTKRAAAIAHGAVEITLRQCSAMRMIRDITGELPTDPQAALDALYMRMRCTIPRTRTRTRI